MKKIKKQSTTSRPHLQKIPWVFPRIPRRRTRTGPEIEPEEPPRPSKSKIPELPFSLPPLSHSSQPFLEPLSSRPSLEKIPKTFWIRRLFKALFKIEPDKPVRMPRFPTLRFPPLYTRFAIMKTYTAVSDANGQVTVTFPRVFRTVPGIVLTGQGDITWFPIVLSKDEFGFTAKILKTAHKHTGSSGGGGSHGHTTTAAGSHGHTAGYGGAHGHTTSAAGGHGHTIGWAGSHSHTIIVDGNHGHTVGGNVEMYLYRDYAVVDLAINSAGAHEHTNPITSGPSTTDMYIHNLVYGSSCAVGKCVSSVQEDYTAAYDHTHTQGDTGSAGSHIHTGVATVDAFVYDMDLWVTAWTTSTHAGHGHNEDADGYHFHTTVSAPGHTHPISNVADHLHSISWVAAHTHPISNAPSHVHGISEDAAAALANTSVTFTYLASEES